MRRHRCLTSPAAVFGIQLLPHDLCSDIAKPVSGQIACLTNAADWEVRVTNAMKLQITDMQLQDAMRMEEWYSATHNDDHQESFVSSDTRSMFRRRYVSLTFGTANDWRVTPAASSPDSSEPASRSSVPLQPCL
ncbi:hypothetical protein M8818_007361 [Zalaria obscura]|uniref:Uncharacterized protein n=1 Tax=Zalaria obscura TaxID=2024903 RepID=A0ACC3S3B2_9PEZI